MRNPFAHIVSFNGTTQRGISVNTDPLAGNGTLLASIGTADPANSGTGMITGEWQAGATMGNAASDVGNRIPGPVYCAASGPFPAIFLALQVG
jgi:hypothetical protein